MLAHCAVNAAAEALVRSDGRRDVLLHVHRCRHSTIWNLLQTHFSSSAADGQELSNSGGGGDGEAGEHAVPVTDAPG